MKNIIEALGDDTEPLLGAEDRKESYGGLPVGKEAFKFTKMAHMDPGLKENFHIMLRS